MTGERQEGQLRIMTLTLVERNNCDTCPQRGHLMFSIVTIGGFLHPFWYYCIT
jgi:hypothetical protein